MGVLLQSQTSYIPVSDNRLNIETMISDTLLTQRRTLVIRLELRLPASLIDLDQTMLMQSFVEMFADLINQRNGDATLSYKPQYLWHTDVSGASFHILLLLDYDILEPLWIEAVFLEKLTLTFGIAWEYTLQPSDPDFLDFDYPGICNNLDYLMLLDNTAPYSAHQYNQLLSSLKDFGFEGVVNEQV